MMYCHYLAWGTPSVAFGDSSPFAKGEPGRAMRASPLRDIEKTVCEDIFLRQGKDGGGTPPVWNEVFEAMIYGLKNVGYRYHFNRSITKDTGRLNLWRPVSGDYARQRLPAGATRLPVSGDYARQRLFTGSTRECRA